MLLTPMRYKDYTWPHNPETYSVEYRRQVVVHKVPFGQYVLQDVGETCRIFQGRERLRGRTPMNSSKRSRRSLHRGERACWSIPSGGPPAPILSP